MVTYPQLRVDSLLRYMREESDLLYINSLFSAYFGILPIVATALRLLPSRKLLIAPRGELGHGALAIRSWKKRPVLAVLKRLLRDLDVCWHASNQDEADRIRKLIASPKHSTFVRSDPPPEPDRDVSSGGHRPIGVVGPVQLAFVGRIVPIKNLSLVLSSLRRTDAYVSLRVAGAIEDERYWNSLRPTLNDLPANVSVDILGHQTGSQVRALLRTSDCMVLPTRGENFGHAIAEALAVGCPVAIPDTTLWTPLIASGSGWIIDADDPTKLTSAIAALAKQTGEETRLLRERTHRAYLNWWESQQQSDSLFTMAMRND